MTRIALVAATALVTAGPAMAHVADRLHSHEMDHASLILGLVLISVGLGAALVIRAQSK